MYWVYRLSKHSFRFTAAEPGSFSQIAAAWGHRTWEPSLPNSNQGQVEILLWCLFFRLLHSIVLNSSQWCWSDLSFLGYLTIFTGMQHKFLHPFMRKSAPTHKYKSFRHVTPYSQFALELKLHQIAWNGSLGGKAHRLIPRSCNQWILRCICDLEDQSNSHQTCLTWPCTDKLTNINLSVLSVLNFIDGLYWTGHLVPHTIGFIWNCQLSLCRPG